MKKCLFIWQLLYLNHICQSVCFAIFFLYIFKSLFRFSWGELRVDGGARLSWRGMAVGLSPRGADRYHSYNGAGRWSLEWMIFFLFRNEAFAWSGRCGGRRWWSCIRRSWCWWLEVFYHTAILSCLALVVSWPCWGAWGGMPWWWCPCGAENGLPPI